MSAATLRNQYLRDQVLNATPARLLTMLYDRLLLDLNRAAGFQDAGNWTSASEQLKHAQDIITELSGSLNADAWDGAAGLFATYNYVGNALMNANIHRNAALTREAISLLEPLRQAWHEAAGMLPASASAAALGYSLA